jgi:hypothetical protein
MQRVRDVTTRQIADEALYRSLLSAGLIPAPPTAASVTSATSPYTAKKTDILIEVDDSGGQCEVDMFATPSVGAVTIKKVTTSNNSVLVGGGGNLIEDPSNPGTWAASVAINPTPSGASAVTWIFTGTRWDAVGGL